MKKTGTGGNPPTGVGADSGRLDRLIAEARRASDERSRSYRDRALKILPWICARCAREFERERLRELTVHHKDGNHEHNPSDGSNWELLCIYCHENEHARVTDFQAGGGGTAIGEPASTSATHRPLAGLGELLRSKGRK